MRKHKKLVQQMVAIYARRMFEQYIRETAISPTRVSLQTLPPEVISHICNYLQFCSYLLNFALVCRYFEEVIFDPKYNCFASSFIIVDVLCETELAYDERTGSLCHCSVLDFDLVHRITMFDRIESFKELFEKYNYASDQMILA